MRSVPVIHYSLRNFRPIIASCVLTLGLAGCATSPSGKPVASAAVAGADLVQVGDAANLAIALYETQPGANATILAQGKQATTVIIAYGQALKDSSATSGDLAQNVQLLETAVSAGVSAMATADPALASKAQGYLDATVAALSLYNADAPAAGLPTIPGLSSGS